MEHITRPIETTELKKIWAIHKNVDSFHTEVDEFYL